MQRLLAITIVGISLHSKYYKFCYILMSYIIIKKMYNAKILHKNRSKISNIQSYSLKLIKRFFYILKSAKTLKNLKKLTNACKMQHNR